MGLKAGDIIRGDQRGKRANDWYVWVVCSQCSKGRWILRWRLKSPNRTGLCWTCSARRNVQRRIEGKHSNTPIIKMLLPSQKGNRNANWKGGLTELVKGIRRSPEYYQWRKAVLERDNSTCQDCGTTEKVEAHHIRAVIDYPEGIFEVKNGLVVCEDCHNRHTFWQKLGKS